MTTEQAQAHIEELKNILTAFVRLPLPAKVSKYDVVSRETGNEYEVSIEAGKINLDKHNFCGRLKGFDTPLLRLDINPGNKHMNRDGTVIEGSHWHIFHEDDHRKAFECQELTSVDFFAQTVSFFEKFSISPLPEIHNHLTMTI